MVTAPAEETQPSLRAVGTIQVWLRNGKLEAQVPIHLKTPLLAIGAEWNSTRKRWILPPCVRLLHLQALGPVALDPDTANDMLRRENLLDLLEHIQEQKDMQLDRPVSPMLDGYQRVGVKFLATARRCILADALGLGKTAQAIAACDYVSAKRVLILVKKSLITNWVKEITRFSLDPSVLAYTTDSKDVPNSRFVVTNYECARLRIKKLLEQKWDVLIVDEAQNMKNRKAARTKAMWLLSKHADFCWLLSATVIRNQVDELWSLLHALYPDVYSSYWSFRKRHCIEEPVYSGGVKVTTRVVGVRDPELLQYELKPLMLARSKSILDLPPITHETVWVGMTSAQRRLYRQLKEAGAALVADSVLIPQNALELMLRLRQAACDPRLVGGDERGEKTLTAVELLTDLVEQGHKVVCFTNWRRYALLLADELRTLSVALYHGGMDAREREAALAAFHRFSAGILIATVQSAGEGLNLQDADVVVWLDRPWVPADVEQAEGRAWRRGQTRPVHVFSLLTAGTVEEYVEKVLAGKLDAYAAARAVQEVLAT